MYKDNNFQTICHAYYYTKMGIYLLDIAPSMNEPKIMKLQVSYYEKIKCVCYYVD